MAEVHCAFSSFDVVDAAALQLQEVELQVGLLKGKENEGNPPDFELSLFNFQTELLDFLTFLEDERIAQSLARAVEDDALLIRQAVQEEHRARNDRTIAFRMTSEENGENLVAPALEESDEEQQQEWASMPDTHPDEIVVAGPSSQYGSKQTRALEHSPSRSSHCLGCKETFPPHKLVRCPCEHVCCTECLALLFTRATKDESLFPPRCCQQKIPRTLMETVLSEDELSRFDKAAVEFTTADRTYCARPTCARFIPSSGMTSDLLVCPYCDMEMCAHCKRGSHEGDCPEDQSLQIMLQLAKGEGWQRCHGCNAIVELDYGCNHMT
ncbi:hypothetical protein MMC09_001229 [Bachmanniomyces sp. S44760]|nr:hypothetical protein [Bachmanniomyces sp. S44760]